MRTIAALIFPGFELLDVFGPLEMFGLLDTDFHIDLVAQKPGPVPSSQRLEAIAAKSINETVAYDILFVPGGRGVREEIKNHDLLEWIEEVSKNAQYTLSVCTGSALLAKAGLLDGRRATTNKAAFGWVAEQGPDVDWIQQARWVEDGPFYTSSGVSAGMDMALAAIAGMHGSETAERVANICEYTWHRDSTHDPFAKLHGLI
jgi:transcriptional regulator GlxA family with amidase domain